MDDTRCFSCGGPYHPASGHLFGEARDIPYCGPCYRRFAAFMKSRMYRDKRTGLDFYEEAATSIKPPSVAARASFAPG